MFIIFRVITLQIGSKNAAEDGSTALTAGGGYYSGEAVVRVYAAPTARPLVVRRYF